MIQIAAKLIGGPVYLPGDNIRCCVSFINKDIKQETLAWSSAQIHCLCVTNDKVITPPDVSSLSPEERSIASGDTSFVPYKGDNGHIVFSTKPKILFCDLKLNPSETKSYLYTEVLQPEIPPTYRGQLVKYSYKITVGTQRVNSPIKLLKIPLRILVVDGFPESSTCEDSVDLSPSNPFLDRCEKDGDLEPTLQMLQNITARRNANFYNITNSKGKVARFCLFKQAYKVGEDIVGTFDFETNTIPCVQFTVNLQCEEVISEKYRLHGKRDRAVTSYSNYHEVCLNLKQCFLNLPIPLHVTPAFTTDLMSLKWKLHFEFVTTSSLNEIRDFENIWKAPKILNIETMVWDLPIQIYPTTSTSDLYTQTKSYVMI